MASFFLCSDFTIGFVTALLLVLIVWYYRNRNKGTSSSDLFNTPTITAHNKLRYQTYLNGNTIPNTWYHIADSDEVERNGEVLYVRAIGQNFAIWRTSDGEPIVMNAYCPHMGANLGVGGKVTSDDCIKCPFHEWKFDKNGKLIDVPYIDNKSKMSRIRCKPIPKYIAKDFCGLLCVYFHADFDEMCPDGQPQFDLPFFIEKNMYKESKDWHLHSKTDIGYKYLSCIDWVDQSGDHGHFSTLHSHFLVPYTTMPLPNWINKLIGISHKCTTVIGGKWNEKLHGKKDSYYGECDEKHYIYFLDQASITWKGKAIEESKSLTKEFYLGPAMMIFHVPLGSMGTGDMKIFVTTTPCLQGGSVMRARVWLSDYSWFLRFVSWFITGVALSQLLSDIEIMENKIRKRKPSITKGCGPYNIVNTWLKAFYSKSSHLVGKCDLDW